MLPVVKLPVRSRTTTTPVWLPHVLFSAMTWARDQIPVPTWPALIDYPHGKQRTRSKRDDKVWEHLLRYRSLYRGPVVRTVLAMSGLSYDDSKEGRIETLNSIIKSRWKLRISDCRPLCHSTFHEFKRDRSFTPSRHVFS